MTRIHVFCEGQTEDVFVRELLQPYFGRIDLWLNPIVIRTGAQGKGGVSTYGKIKWQIDKKCKEDPTSWVTTLLDFYGLPHDFPCMREQFASSTIKAKAVENAFQTDISHLYFIANLIVHEFEGLLFSSPQTFSAWFDDSDVVGKLVKIRNEFDSPEQINDSINTAPSKRINEICNSYDKVTHGSLIALDIGLDAIRQECPLFNAWIKRIEELGKRGNANS